VFENCACCACCALAIKNFQRWLIRHQTCSRLIQASTAHIDRGTSGNGVPPTMHSEDGVTFENNLLIPGVQSVELPVNEEQSNVFLGVPLRRIKE
jgi:hypothetical protein